MVHRSLYGPMCLYACLTTTGYAPNEMTDGVLGYFLPDLDQGIIELLDRLRCDLVPLDGPKQCPRGVLLGLGHASVADIQWYQFLHPLGTGCILSPHEARHCRATGGTQDPIHQRGV